MESLYQFSEAIMTLFIPVALVLISRYMITRLDKMGVYDRVDELCRNREHLEASTEAMLRNRINHNCLMALRRGYILRSDYDNVMLCFASYKEMFGDNASIKLSIKEISKVPLMEHAPYKGESVVGVIKKQPTQKDFSCKHCGAPLDPRKSKCEYCGNWWRENSWKSNVAEESPYFSQVECKCKMDNSKKACVEYIKLMDELNKSGAVLLPNNVDFIKLN